MPWTTKKGIRKIIFPSLTIAANSQVEKTLERLKPDSKICDLGAGGRRITENIFTIDGLIQQGTDLVCDIHEIPLPDKTFDCIFCTGTLEHVEDPRQVLNEILRLLKTGGIVHVEVPFIQGFHPDPDDYWRWTLNGLRLFCSKTGFKEVDSGVHIGPASAFNWVLISFIDTLFIRRWLRRGISTIIRMVFSPLRYMDYFLIDRSDAALIASGVYFIGRK